MSSPLPLPLRFLRSASDHEQLLHMSREQFAALMNSYAHDAISATAEPGLSSRDYDPKPF